MDNVIYRVQDFFDTGIGTAIKAVLLLIIAFIVAAIAKSLITKLLNKTKLNEKTAGSSTNAVELIGKLVQLIVFLLFVPGIFETLGMEQVSAPIITMLNNVLGYVPNIIAAIIILWVGFYIAKLVRDLLIPVLNKLEVNKLQNMAGIQVSDTGRLSNTLAYIVYVLIIIPVIITALNVLDIKAITDPAIAMLSVIFNYIPNILAALVIISIGWVLAKFIGNIVTRLIAASGLDAKIAGLMDMKNSNLVLSNLVGKTVEVVLIIFFIVESFSTLHLGILTNIGVAVIGYMPAVLTAVLIFAICMFVASIAAKTLRKNGHEAGALAVQYLIFAVGIFFILNQLGIAKTLVDSTFILIIAALAVAFAISFGVGGRDFARNILAELQKKLNIPQAKEESTKRPFIKK